jgi:hypothetical protein
MVQSDALSRRPDHVPKTDNDNEEVTLLPNELFLRQIDVQTCDVIIKVITKDDFPNRAIVALKEKGTPPIKSDLGAWELREGLLFFNDRCYVPTDLELRRNLVSQFHDSTMMGHPGQYKTMEAIRKHYWWLGMYTFVRNYMAGYAVCQQNKVNTHPTTLPLTPIKTNGGRLFSMITMDFITDLPASHGYDSILVVVDYRLMKGVVLIPYTKMFGALETADALLKNVYRRFRLPDILISDRGPQFASHTFWEMGKLLGIELRMSTAYHPQTDGQTEHLNQELETYLRIYCGNRPMEWKPLIPVLEFAHNNWTHETTKQTLFFLMGGYETKVFPLPFEGMNVPSMGQRLAVLQKARDKALAAHELT